MPPSRDNSSERGSGASGHGGQTSHSDVSPRVFVPYTDFNGAQLGLHPAPAFEEGTPGFPASPTAFVTPFKRSEAGVPDAAPDLGLHLHLHFPGLLKEMAYWLGHVPFPFALYVSVTDPARVEETEQLFRSVLPRAKVTVRAVENRGRDLGPFVTEFARALAGHEFVGHIHGKRSVHSNWKSDWRRQLLVHLLGSPAAIRSVFDRFASDARLGMVFPVYHHSLREQISWGNNFAACEALARTLDLSVEADKLVLFPAGSMFWARSSALEPLLRGGFDLEMFPAETGQLDGTTAHALERLFGEIVDSRGGRIMQIRNEKGYTSRCFDPPGTRGLGRWLRRWRSADE